MVTLRPYQQEAHDLGMAILVANHLLYLSLEVRTGKTLTALSIAETYQKHVFSPFQMKVLFLTRKRAIPSIVSDIEKLNPSYRAYVTNYEAIHRVKKNTTIAPEDYDFFILDEAHCLGAYPKPSNRAKNLSTVIGKKPVIYLSGTPSPESYSQLYHQFYVSYNSPFKEYINFYKWAKDYVNVRKRRINGYDINDYKDAYKDKVWDKVKHLFVTVTQEDAGFEAFVDENVIECPMSAKICRMIRTIEKHKIALYGKDKYVTVDSGAALLTKMSQLSGGTVILDGDSTGTVIDTSKAEFIKQKFARQKIAIFYKYKAELEILKETFPEWTDIPEQFNRKHGITFLGQIQSASEGVDLQTADALVMYNIDFSARAYWQSRARIQSRERQGSAPLYWVFSDCGIEDKVHKAVMDKKNFTYTYYRKNYATL